MTEGFKEGLFWVGAAISLAFLLYLVVTSTLAVNARHSACTSSCMPDALLDLNLDTSSGLTYCFCSRQTIILNQDNRLVNIRKYAREPVE